MRAGMLARRDADSDLVFSLEALVTQITPDNLHAEVKSDARSLSPRAQRT